MKTLLRMLILTLLMFLCGALISTGCYFVGSAFDQNCIEGRLSEKQAKAINELEWEKCPYYRKECRAEINDRVIKRKCSELSRRIFFWN